MNTLKSSAASAIMQTSLKEPMQTELKEERTEGNKVRKRRSYTKDARRDDRTSGESVGDGLHTRRPTSRRQTAEDAAGCRVSENEAPTSKTHAQESRSE